MKPAPGKTALRLALEHAWQDQEAKSPRLLVRWQFNALAGILMRANRLRIGGETTSPGFRCRRTAVCCWRAWASNRIFGTMRRPGRARHIGMVHQAVPDGRPTNLCRVSS